MEKALYGTEGSFAPSYFSATEGGIEENQHKHELILIMYGYKGNGDEILLNEFKVGLKNYLAELAKRGVEVSPKGTPTIYKGTDYLYKNLKAFSLASLLALPGSIMIWLLFILLDRKNTMTTLQK